MSAPHLLIVEDTPQTRLLIEEVVHFVLPQYQVVAVPDPRAALLQIEKQRPDIIITDLRMPGMDGYAFIEKLESEASTAGIPIMIMTAFANQDEDVLIRRKLAEMGIQRDIPILSKPFKIPIFREAMLKLAAQDTPAAADATTTDLPQPPTPDASSTPRLAAAPTATNTQHPPANATPDAKPTPDAEATQTDPPAAPPSTPAATKPTPPPTPTGGDDKD